MAGAMTSGDLMEKEWSEFKKGLAISESSLSLPGSSSSGNRDFDKICVVVGFCPGGKMEDKSSDCWIYCIDVNSCDYALSTRLEPIIYLHLRDFGDPKAYAIVGSRLYMFGQLEKGSTLPLDMYYYDMEPCLSSSTTSRLFRESFVKGRPMNGIKSGLVAVVMGDSRRICVFGTVLPSRLCRFYPYEPYSYEAHHPSFELFDTSNEEWKSLPEPFEKDVDVDIHSYCVHGSCLLINTFGHGIHGINVDVAQPKWVTLDTSGEKCVPLFGMFAMVGNVMFTPFMAKRWGHPNQYLYPFQVLSRRTPLVSPLPSFYNRVPLANLWFDERCNNLCIVQAGSPRSPCYASFVDNYYELQVQILKFDDAAVFEKLGYAMSKWEGIRCEKSFAFALPPILYDSMDIIGCFPIKEDAYGKKKRKLKSENPIESAEFNRRQTRSDFLIELLKAIIDVGSSSEPLKVQRISDILSAMEVCEKNGVGSSSEPSKVQRISDILSSMGVCEKKGDSYFVSAIKYLKDEERADTFLALRNDNQRWIYLMEATIS